jgi:uncharacterized phage protein gp47/JayE
MSPPDPRMLQVGRQPIIDYVTKDYAGFRQGMIDLIPSLLPRWTDRSENDFGIVLIELFAYVADILSYYQDRAANEAFLRTATQRRSVIELLRLIGYQVDPGLSATTVLHLDLAANVELTAANLPYRVKTAGTPGQPDVTFEITHPVSLKAKNSSIEIASSLEAGATFVDISNASHALEAEVDVYIEETIMVQGKAHLHRSQLLRIVEIETRSGTVDRVFWTPALEEPFGANASLKGNNVLASHGSTITDEPIFVGDGKASQSFELSRGPVSCLLTPSRTASGRRSAPELRVTVNGAEWSLVDSFFNSGQFDPHFTTLIDDGDSLTVQFGTGARGALVSAGAEVKVVYRVGLGQAGNVGPDTLTVPVTSRQEVRSVSNPFAATGGADRESIEEAKISGPGSVISQGRAVTLQDFELLSEGFAGVGKAKARIGLRGGYKVVQVFIVPANATGTTPPTLPSAQLKADLAAFLTSRMLVNRMAGVDVLDPVYVGIDVSIDVHLKVTGSASRVRAEVNVAINGLLAFAAVDLGSAVRVGDVFAAVYPIPGISFVRLRGLARADRPALTAATGEFTDIALLDGELSVPGNIKVNTIGGSP